MIFAILVCVIIWVIGTELFDSKPKKYKWEELPELEEGECPDCFEYGYDIRSHCTTCFGKGWVTPSKHGTFYKSIERPYWVFKKEGK